MENDYIEEIRQKSDIVELIGSAVNLRRRGSRYVGLCPFHVEKTPSFSVTPSMGLYHCFGCGAGGDIFSFLMEYENMTFPEAVLYLAERYGVDIPKNAHYSNSSDRERQRKVLEANKDAANYFYTRLFTYDGKKALEYFYKRGLSGDTIKKFGLGYSTKYTDDLYKYIKKKGYPDDILKDTGLFIYDEKRGTSDRFFNRVMFPILDGAGHVIAFGGRVLGDGLPKYINTPETGSFDKSKTVFALNHARKSGRKGLILCEGYMDVISLHQAGIDSAVASMGTSLTAGHAGILSKYCDQVYICYDSDEAGRKASFRAIPILRSRGIIPYVLDMSPYKDPDELIKSEGKEAFEERIRTCKNALNFQEEYIKEDYDINDPGEKTLFLKEMSKILSGFDDRLERENYVKDIALRYGVDFETLKREVNIIGETLREKTEGFYPKKKQKAPETAGIDKAQNAVLTAILERPNILGQVEKYISPDEFTEDIYRKIAGELFTLIEKGEKDLSKLLSSLESDEDRKKASEIFQGEDFSEMNGEELGKALKENILKIKRNGIELMEASHDLNGFNDLINKKNEIKRMEKERIVV